MKQTDVRVCPFHAFTFQFQHQSQDTMCSRVLRPEVEGEVLHLGALEVCIDFEICERSLNLA